MMKFKRKDAAADIIIILVILVIFATTAVIVFSGIGEKAEAMGNKTSQTMNSAGNVNAVPGNNDNTPPVGGSEIPPEVPEGPEAPVIPDSELPDDDFFYIDEEILETMVIGQPATAEERLHNNQVLEAQIEQKLIQNNNNENINLRSIKLTRHEAYVLQEYTNSYNGYDFNGMLPPEGKIRDVFVKYKIIS